MGSNEVITTARNFLKARTDSLQSDVRYCILLNQGTQDWPAPFPVLLYCFATIDLLSALYAGNASDKAPTARQSLEYMTGIMKYPRDIAELIQEVYRHKLTHLAQIKPKTAILKNKLNHNKYFKKKIQWGYHHNKREIHLSIIQDSSDKTVYNFFISIWSLVEDIIDSVWSANGYFDQLSRNVGNIQDNFEKAYKQIME